MSRSNYKRDEASKPQNTNKSNMKGKSKRYSNNNNRSKREDNKPVPNAKIIKDAINDISWYAHNPQMLKDSASISFNQMLGLPVDFGAFGAGSSGHITDKLPGLITLRTVPTFGAVEDDSAAPSSAINIAAENLYSFVRHANSGHANYDPADLMVYIAAMDQLYSFHAELVRAYGLLRFYSGYNRYLGKYIVEALGFNYDNLLSNMAGFRYAINALGAKLSTFAVPAIFPIFERHRWIYSNIYMDRPSTRAQMYAFVPEYYGAYNEPVSAGGVDYKAGIRARVNPEGYLKTFSDIQTAIDAVISPVIYSEDIGIMSGDILKAYGAEKCYQINALPEDYIVGPVYVEEVLKQIHNSVTVGVPYFPYQNNSPMMLYQDGVSPIIYTWHETSDMIPWIYKEGLLMPGPNILDTTIATEGKLIDTNADSPTPEDVMIMTRLTNIPVESQAKSVTAFNMTSELDQMNALQGKEVFASFAADVIMHFSVFNGEYDSTHAPFFTRMYSINFVVDDGNQVHGNTKFYRDAISDISKFNWHPIIYEFGFTAADVASTDPIDPSNISLRVIGDIDNCVVVSGRIIDRMHDVALLSMLNVPSAVLTKGI